MEYSTVPVLVKLTPNVGDIIPMAWQPKRWSNVVSLINTIKSIIGVVSIISSQPVDGNKSTNGGYCGAAIETNRSSYGGFLARHRDFNIPISGIGGITNWRDALDLFSWA